MITIIPSFHSLRMERLGPGDEQWLAFSDLGLAHNMVPRCGVVITIRFFHVTILQEREGKREVNCQNDSQTVTK